MTNNLAYTFCGVYYIPDIALSSTIAKPLGKYGFCENTAQ